LFEQILMFPSSSDGQSSCDDRILILDMYDLCALSADSVLHMLRWALPGSVTSFVTLVMITL